MNLWPHQQRGLAQLRGELTPGNAVCVTSPTGGGKTVMMVEAIKMASSVVLYTNRRMLLDQTSAVLTRHGIKHGIRAAGHEQDWFAPVQLSSIQTEDARCLKSDKWELHRAELVLIDEAHVNKESTMVEIVRRHQEQGAAVVGFTATPLDIGHLYSKLIVAGTPSELRNTKALVAAAHYGPDEPDLKAIKRTKTGEYKQADIVKAIMTHSIFGRVMEHWRSLNPEEKPTLLFAPGVKESLWFAEELTKNGIRSAHIDGNDIWIDGTFYKSDQAARDEVKRLSESGEVKIVCNRFVMREGIDWPHLYHGIFATIFGALTSYLQSGGRLLRAFPGKEIAIVQDHGGNWHRHGSLNSDREWSLEISDYILSETRAERLREKKEPEPINCPVCFAIRLSGPICHACGHASHAHSRMVVQRDGTLKEMRGDIYKPRVTYTKSDVERKWEQCYHRCKNTDRTFNQARGLFAYENNFQWPPSGLPLMPRDELDWFRSVKDVPRERLVSTTKGSPLK